MAPSARLLQAFRNTSYVAWAPGAPKRPAFILRVGVSHPAFQPTGPWVMVGAYTGSTAHTPRNLSAHRRLGEALRKAAKVLWEGQGFGEDGKNVEEKMWLAQGVTREQALSLGRQFRQQAVLLGVPGGTPRLVLCTTGEDVSEDVPRPELPAASLADVRRRVLLISRAMERAGMKGMAKRVGLSGRGQRQRPPGVTRDLAGNLEPLEVINACLDRLALPGWELALVEDAQRAGAGRLEQLSACESLARETWQRMGLPPPPALAATSSTR